MIDILKVLFQECPFDKKIVKSITVGERHVCILLNNGNIGVCATLGEKLADQPIEILLNPNFLNINHRIIVNAWINACGNYNNALSGNNDIFEAIDFKEVKNLVMIGYFGSLAQKFIDKNINISIFDLDPDDKPVEPIHNQADALKSANCVIITSTTLANNTYADIISQVKPECKTYFLGPSTPLLLSMFNLPSVAGIFGSRFNKFDYQVLSAIENGGGARSFLNRMQKAYILKNCN
jgi:uncharacterized protein (DUF4213/DUF364 family)